MFCLYFSIFLETFYDSLNSGILCISYSPKNHIIIHSQVISIIEIMIVVSWSYSVSCRKLEIIFQPFLTAYIRHYNFLVVKK